MVVSSLEGVENGEGRLVTERTFRRRTGRLRRPPRAKDGNDVWDEEEEGEAEVEEMGEAIDDADATDLIVSSSIAKQASASTLFLDASPVSDNSSSESSSDSASSEKQSSSVSSSAKESENGSSAEASPMLGPADLFGVGSLTVPSTSVNSGEDPQIVASPERMANSETNVSLFSDKSPGSCKRKAPNRETGLCTPTRGAKVALESDLVDLTEPRVLTELGRQPSSHPDPYEYHPEARAFDFTRYANLCSFVRSSCISGLKAGFGSWPFVAAVL